MKISMNDEEVKTLTQLKRFTQGMQPVRLQFENQAACYRWIAKTLKGFSPDTDAKWEMKKNYIFSIG